MHLCATRPADDPNAGFRRCNLGVALGPIDEIPGPWLDCTCFGVAAVVTVERRMPAVVERVADATSASCSYHSRCCGVVAPGLRVGAGSLRVRVPRLVRDLCQVPLLVPFPFPNEPAAFGDQRCQS